MWAYIILGAVVVTAVLLYFLKARNKGLARKPSVDRGDRAAHKEQAQPVVAVDPRAQEEARKREEIGRAHV